MSTYTAEADALEKQYWETVGWALQYGIKVYLPGTGGRLKSLGDLEDQVRDHQSRMGDGWSRRAPPATDVPGRAGAGLLHQRAPDDAVGQQPDDGPSR